MSRVGKAPIAVPSGVEVKIDGQAVEVKGPKGTLNVVVPEPINAALEDGQIVTNGGRVLGVTAKAGSIREAVELAYQGVEKIHFAGAEYRKDIAHRALERLNK